MHKQEHLKNPVWVILVPLLAAAMVGVYYADLIGENEIFTTLKIALLCGVIFASVHHAEIVGARVGEPFGSIILAVAVTVIEVGLIVSLMLAAFDGGPTIARDTVYSAVMIVMTGLIGLCLVLGGQKHFEQRIRVSGTSSYLAVIGTLATFALILPNYTISTKGPTYSSAQLAAAAFISIVLYGAFLFVQTIRHRDYFLATADNTEVQLRDIAPPKTQHAWTSLIFLIVSLACVIMLAKVLAPKLDLVIKTIGLPKEFTGVIIAALVLAPESIAAVRASLANMPQTSINLALGSALASIALTIPVITFIAAFTDVQLILGVSAAKAALLILAMFVSVITLLPGRTTVLQGVVHLSIFVMFLVVAAVP